MEHIRPRCLENRKSAFGRPGASLNRQGRTATPATPSSIRMPLLGGVETSSCAGSMGVVGWPRTLLMTSFIHAGSAAAKFAALS